MRGCIELIPGAMRDKVWGVICDAVIDWKIDDNGSTCATSRRSPFWLDASAGDEGFYFYTYCSLRQSVGEAELFRFVADRNLALPMVEFSASKCGRGFRAHYWFCKPEGLRKRNSLFAGRRFAEIFVKPLEYEGDHVAGMDFEPKVPAQSGCLSALVY